MQTRAPVADLDSLDVERSDPTSWTEIGLARKNPLLAVTRQIAESLGSQSFESDGHQLASERMSVCLFVGRFLGDLQEFAPQQLLLLQSLLRRGLDYLALTYAGSSTVICDSFTQPLRELAVSFFYLPRPLDDVNSRRSFVSVKRSVSLSLSAPRPLCMTVFSSNEAIDLSDDKLIEFVILDLRANTISFSASSDFRLLLRYPTTSPSSSVCRLSHLKFGSSLSTFRITGFYFHSLSTIISNTFSPMLRKSAS